MKITNKFKIENLKPALPAGRLKISKSKAFTLIELLVVMGIMVLLTGISAAAIVSIKKERKVEVVAEEVKNYLIQARSYAIAPSREGVTAVEFNIDSSKLLTVKEIGPTPAPLAFISKQLPSNISVTGITNPFVYNTTNANQIGQITTGLSDIVLEDTSGEKRTLKINALTGNVSIQ